MKPSDAVFLFLALGIIIFVVFGAVSEVRGQRAAEAERLETLQECIELDNPVEWCIEQFGG